MKNKDKKTFQNNYANENIKFYFELLEKRENPNFDKKYIQEIKKISQGFNIRLTKEQKLKFCSKCETYWDVNTRQIRLNSTLKTKEYICKNCANVRRFKYKD